MSHTYKVIATPDQREWLSSQLAACQAVIQYVLGATEGRIVNVFGNSLGELSRMTRGGSDALMRTTSSGMAGRSSVTLASPEWRSQFVCRQLGKNNRLKQWPNGDLYLSPVTSNPRLVCEGLNFIVDNITMLIFRLDEVGDWWVTLHLNLRPPLRRNMPDWSE